mmetsp:Transcript_1014/g.1443  ORF Transcript_1014/g.1443 Transcript_1014/m.1443 type:complete len:243 (-) Transcript_1014:307-1035(-)
MENASKAKMISSTASPTLIRTSSCKKTTPLTTQLLKVLTNPPDSNATYVGVKWHMNQLAGDVRASHKSIESFAKFINEKNIKIISIQRMNALRRCFSLYDMSQRHAAGMVNQKSSIEAEKHPNLKSFSDDKRYDVPINYISNCIQRHGRHEETRAEFLKLVKPSLVIKLKYEDFCDKEVQQLATIQTFLKLKTPIGVVSQYEKMHTKHVEQMIKNWGELRSALEKQFDTQLIAEWASHKAVC